MKKDWTLYCIYCELDTGPRTYVGVTVNLSRRLRQHNGAIKGGAKATTSLLSRGAVWKLLYTVTGFKEQRPVLQWEWRLHRKKRYDRCCAVCNRFRGLRAAMKMESVTRKAPVSSTLNLSVKIHADIPDLKTKASLGAHVCLTFPKKTAFSKRYNILNALEATSN